jgi:hypothetical protein
MVEFPDGFQVVLVADSTANLERAVAKIGAGRVKFSRDMVEKVRMEPWPK